MFDKYWWLSLSLFFYSFFLPHEKILSILNTVYTHTLDMDGKCFFIQIALPFAFCFFSLPLFLFLFFSWGDLLLTESMMHDALDRSARQWLVYMFTGIEKSISCWVSLFSTLKKMQIQIQADFVTGKVASDACHANQWNGRRASASPLPPDPHVFSLSFSLFLSLLSFL